MGWGEWGGERGDYRWGEREWGWDHRERGGEARGEIGRKRERRRVG